MRTPIHISFYILFFLSTLNAQDPHFSQFFSSPLTLNPANTGNFSGKFRVASNYRNQWPGFNKAYSTTTLSLDAPILSKYIPTNDRIAVGGFIMSDATGNGVLTQQSIATGLSYAKSLDEEGNHSIAVGFQTSYLNLRFNPEKANFEDELSPSGFDLVSAESFFLNTNQRSVFDVHTGIQYVGQIRDESLIYLGASVYHLSRPKVGMLDLSNQNKMRYALNGGGYTSLDPENYIHFSTQFQLQGSFRDYSYGAAWNRLLNARSNSYIQAYLGMWIRNNEFLIPYLGVDWNGFQVGFSYDIGFGVQKSAATQYQSAEVSFIWTMIPGERIMNIKCPKF